ncbi:hypothetical protein DMENIID0001_073650 [Sergentomyia squamirostris]
MFLLWSIILILPLIHVLNCAPTTQTATQISTEKENAQSGNAEDNIRFEVAEVAKNIIHPKDKKFTVDTRIRRSPQEFVSGFSNFDPDCELFNSKYFSKCNQYKYPPLSPKRISGLRTWKSVNLSGLRQGALFADEPSYLLVRREISDLPENFDFRDPFIPPRGRKKSNYNMLPKRNSLESNLFDNTDLFMPQRGKKSGHSKMANFDDIIPTDELFFPNRGKKVVRDVLWDKRGFPLDLDDPTLFYPNRGKKAHWKREAAPESDSLEAKNKIKKESAGLADDLLSQDLFFPNRGKKGIFEADAPESGAFIKSHDPHQRELLSNFSENHDTFYSDRGRQRSPADTLDDLSRANEMPRFNGFPNFLINSGYVENSADLLDYYNNVLEDNP